MFMVKYFHPLESPINKTLPFYSLLKMFLAFNFRRVTPATKIFNVEFFPNYSKLNFGTCTACIGKDSQFSATVTFTNYSWDKEVMKILWSVIKSRVNISLLHKITIPYLWSKCPLSSNKCARLELVSHRFCIVVLGYYEKYIPTILYSVK